MVRLCRRGGSMIGQLGRGTHTGCTLTRLRRLSAHTNERIKRQPTCNCGKHTVPVVRYPRPQARLSASRLLARLLPLSLRYPVHDLTTIFPYGLCHAPLSDSCHTRGLLAGTRSTLTITNRLCRHSSLHVPVGPGPELHSITTPGTAAEQKPLTGAVA